MIIKDLASTSFNDLVVCFIKSFENYFVKMPTDPAYYRQRWKMALVNFNYSYGMFDGDKLVGFILHAIDTRNDKLTAYNAGTGVLPDYRGKKVVQAIYEFAIPQLRKIGIEVCILEVIVENEIAIKAYQRVGFQKIKRYKCYRGELSVNNTSAVVLSELPFEQTPWTSLPNQELYSWENQEASLLNGPFRFFWVLHNEDPESFLIINPCDGYLAQFDIIEKSVDGWNRLFKGIQQVAKSVKINNVDERLSEKIKYLASSGLENPVDQFEMCLEL